MVQDILCTFLPLSPILGDSIDDTRLSRWEHLETHPHVVDPATSPIINPVRVMRYSGHEQDFFSEMDLELH